jgi:hypothetical protein
LADQPDEAQLADSLRTLIAACALDDAWRERGAWLQARVLIGLGGETLLLRIERGVLTMQDALPPLTAWDFAIRGTAQAWAQFWRQPPPPGWHDLLALTKRGEMRIEGNLQPLMANLQYFKDLLALPRGVA